MPEKIPKANLMKYSCGNHLFDWLSLSQCVYSFDQQFSARNLCSTWRNHRDIPFPFRLTTKGPSKWEMECATRLVVVYRRGLWVGIWYLDPPKCTILIYFTIPQLLINYVAHTLTHTVARGDICMSSDTHTLTHGWVVGWLGGWVVQRVGFPPLWSCVQFK